MDGSEQEKRRGKGKGQWNGGEGKKGDFQKFEILTASTPLQCQLAPPCQISCRSVKPFRIYGRLLIFQDGGRPPSSILTVQNFNCPYPSEGQNASSYQILCKLVKALRYSDTRYSDKGYLAIHGRS